MSEEQCLSGCGLDKEGEDEDDPCYDFFFANYPKKPPKSKVIHRTKQDSIHPASNPNL